MICSDVLLLEEILDYIVNTHENPSVRFVKIGIYSSSVVTEHRDYVELFYIIFFFSCTDPQGYNCNMHSQILCGESAKKLDFGYCMDLVES